MRTVLHAGSGDSPLPDYLFNYAETRLDIDPQYAPDIIASIMDMGDIGPFDCVYSAHVLEHLLWHEADVALSEFYRVLSPDGHVIVICPDTEEVKATDEVLYVSPAGPITGIDILWGFRRFVREGNVYMQHKCGFVAETLKKKIEDAGFKNAVCHRHSVYNLMAGGTK